MNGRLPKRRDVLGFVADFRLLSDFQGSQFNFKEAFFFYHRSREISWEDAACVGYLPYVRSDDDLFDISALKATSRYRTAADVQIRIWIEAVSIKLKPGPRKALEEAVHDVSLELGDFDRFFGLSCRCSFC